MKANTLRGYELTVRCIFCGDSQSQPTHGHLQINLKSGLYHCYRCRASGHLPYEIYFQLLESAGIGKFEPAGYLLDPEEWPELIPGPFSARHSLLTRFQTIFNNQRWDAFEMRDPTDGEVIGVNLRLPGLSSSHGNLGIGWVGDDLPISTPTQPLYVVEGSYDVIREDHVCTFGFINQTPLNLLKGHFVVLVPDGDVWTKPDLRQRFMTTITRSMSPRWDGATILGIDVILGGQDPDEVEPADRIAIRGRQEMFSFLSDISSSKQTCYRNVQLSKLRGLVHEHSF